jgi:hypothetical protein
MSSPATTPSSSSTGGDPPAPLSWIARSSILPGRFAVLPVCAARCPSSAKCSSSAGRGRPHPSSGPWTSPPCWRLVRPGSMGRPLPRIEAAIVRRLDDGGLEVLAEPDVEGELASIDASSSMHSPARSSSCARSRGGSRIPERPEGACGAGPTIGIGRRIGGDRESGSPIREPAAAAGGRTTMSRLPFPRRGGRSIVLLGPNSS